MYRCRIGCFNSSFKAPQSKCATSTRPGSGSRKKTLLLILLVLLFSYTATVIHAYNSKALPTSNPSTVPYKPSPRSILWHSVELQPWPPPYSPCPHYSPTNLDELLSRYQFQQSSAPGTWQPSSSFQRPVVPVASRWRDFQCIGAWGVDPPQQVTHCSFVTNHDQYINKFSLLEQRSEVSSAKESSKESSAMQPSKEFQAMQFSNEYSANQSSSSTSFQWPAIPVASRWRCLQCIGAWGVDPPHQVTHCSFVTNHEYFTNNLSLLEQVELDICPHSAHKWLSRKDRNFWAKMTHGNRRERGLKIVHWNKGPSYLQNKHQEIETVIAGHRPHILGLSEANLWKDHDISAVQYPDYQLHTCSTINNPNLNVSRVVVYTHNSVIVKRRPDLENDNISSIWLEVGLPHKRKILMCHAYREWKHMAQNDGSSATLNAACE